MVTNFKQMQPEIISAKTHFVKSWGRWTDSAVRFTSHRTKKNIKKDKRRLQQQARTINKRKVIQETLIYENS